MVAHWMATGSLDYPFASLCVSATTQANRGSSNLTARAKPDVRGVEVLGELAIHRESLERILVESPQSLASILTALVDALPDYEQTVPIKQEEPARDGLFELMGV
jgi:hypothetical protein